MVLQWFRRHDSRSTATACPFSKWFISLEAVAAAKVWVAVSRMEQGNLSREGLKIINLIGDGTKRRQQQDIDHAVALWEDYNRRKTSIRLEK